MTSSALTAYSLDDIKNQLLDIINHSHNLKDDHTLVKDKDLSKSGCIICGCLVLLNNFSKTVKKYSCGHNVYVEALLNYSIYNSVKSIRNPQITEKQKEEITVDFITNLEHCPLCKLFGECEMEKDEKLVKYYCLPPVGDVYDMVDCLYPLFNKQAFQNDNQYLHEGEPDIVDTTGYRGTGLHIIHHDGITEVNRREYYPVWDLYKKIVTFNIIYEWNICSFEKYRGFRICPTIMIYPDMSIHSCEDNDDKNDSIESYIMTYSGISELKEELQRKKELIFTFGNKKTLILTEKTAKLYCNYNMILLATTED